MIEGALALLYFLFSVLLLPYGYNCFFMVYAASKYRARRPGSIEDHPVVTIQLPVYNERYVVSRLIRAVCALDWPRDRLEVLVLDDSSDNTSSIIDSEVAAFRSKGFDIRAIRRAERIGFKAGALQNALRYTHGRYVAVFDADFIPSPGFLSETIPVMEGDPSLGFVQARWGHVNRDYSKLTEVFALGIDGHHVVEQSGRSALGLLMNFNGSGGVLRTAAIVDAGGWASDTLSEDMDLSYRMQLRGWSPLYLRDVTVPAELPPNMPAFRNQQARWARGSIQCGRKLLRRVWSSPRFSLLQKIQGTMHLTYYAIHLLMVLSLIVAVPLLVLNAFPLVPFLMPYAALFGLCAVSSSAMYYASIRWQGLSFRQKLPYLGLLSLVGYGLSAQCSLSVIRGILSYGGVFERTPKYNISGKGDEWRDKLYKPLKGVPLLELTMALYASIGIAFALSEGLWWLAFYLLVYVMGYALVAYYTNLHFKQSLNTPHQEIGGSG